MYADADAIPEMATSTEREGGSLAKKSVSEKKRAVSVSFTMCAEKKRNFWHENLL